MNSFLRVLIISAITSVAFTNAIGVVAAPAKADATIPNISALIKAKRDKEALPLLNAYIQSHPADVNGYRNRSVCYLHLGNYQGALKDANYALKLEPRNPFGYSFCGLVYNQMGKYQEALVEFGRAIALDPKNEPAYGARAYTYYLLKNYGLAEADCTTIIEKINPSSRNAYKMRAEIYSAMGKLELAEQDVIKAATLNSRKSK